MNEVITDVVETPAEVGTVPTLPSLPEGIPEEIFVQTPEDIGDEPKVNADAF